MALANFYDKELVNSPNNSMKQEYMELSMLLSYEYNKTLYDSVMQTAEENRDKNSGWVVCYCIVEYTHRAIPIGNAIN